MLPHLFDGGYPGISTPGRAKLSHEAILLEHHAQLLHVAVHRQCTFLAVMEEPLRKLHGQETNVVDSA